MKFIRVALLVALAGCGGEEVVEEPAPVVFIGDSLTDGWNLPPTIINAGISGQVSGQMNARFDQDVLAHHPSTVAILAGTNDIRFLADVSVDHIADMAQRAKSKGACVILGTLPPIEGWASLTSFSDAQGDLRLATFNAEVSALAQSNGYLLADYYAVMQGAWFADEVHPSPEGHARMWRVVEPLLSRCASGH